MQTLRVVHRADRMEPPVWETQRLRDEPVVLHDLMNIYSQATGSDKGRDVNQCELQEQERCFVQQSHLQECSGHWNVLSYYLLDAFYQPEFYIRDKLQICLFYVKTTRRISTNLDFGSD